MSCLTGLVLISLEPQLTFDACGRNREQSNTSRASFLGRYCLQFLIACNMQKQRGKACEIESHVWRQVDVAGVVPNCQLCIDQPQVYQRMSCIDAVFQTLQSRVLGQDITRRTLTFFVRHRPHHVYPHIYLTSRM